ncbi:RNA polymerase sigma factor [Cryobacterium sp. TMT1-21]|uniref:RNA polymerase sigma factor n=1 Tax=Cryobacterium shii TaxID=1259235 RepID=A0AAQ2C6B3_9MICO|nr:MULTISPECIES: RNA polymerase sigma factor [Cryobacterium]TFC47112.1 RNA polymerase sigma factor [Cryobacterium shii]TFC85419.1 RNA polymerase sigma factor [Cryobacterium sp. TmT2-59]TFD13097.1 RNA polymerase sigma factor [Cryobacterium sp. TMT4-10]TFD13809.1 RNA polymerase sigma factor [Cryobacterium sp. TMT1-21]TFD16962.1 RNA polymerase sigma factor [Cryobacterium sp. TMT2-23]
MTTTPTRAPLASPLESFPDQTLADRAADGDMRAFEVLVRRYGPLMRVYASRVLGSNDEMDDVVQEAFITAWQQLPTLENGAAVKSWLMRIVSRKSIDRVRARRRHVDIDLTDAAAPEHESPHRLVEAESQTEELTRVLATLPEDQRRCWMLRELAECSYGEIAEQLELPVSTIRGLLARARKTLLHEMEEWR